MELDVLADQRNLDRFSTFVDPLDQGVPVGQVPRVLGRQAQLLADHRVEALLALKRRGTRYTSGTSIAEITAAESTSAKSAIIPDLRGERLPRARDDDVRVDTDAPGSLTECCVGFVFRLTGVLDERNRRDVDIDDVFRADLTAELADRLEERQGLDVAHGAADLGAGDVGVAGLGDRADPAFLISFVMCGITWTVGQMLLRSLRRTRSQIEPAVWLAFRARFSSMKRS